MRDKRHIFTNIDLPILLLYLTLVIMGWMNIYAATTSEFELGGGWRMDASYVKQLIWIGTSFVLIGGIFLLDTRFFQMSGYLLYGLSVFLLMAVLLFGTTVKGAKSWFVLGPISFQPAELAKFATALALSKLLSNIQIRRLDLKTRLRAFTLLLLPAALILLQPDMGSTLVFLSFIFVLYREGLSGNFLLTGLLAAVLFIVSLLVNTAVIELPFGWSLTGIQGLLLSILVILLVIYKVFQKYKSIHWVLLLVFGVIAGYVASVDYLFNEVLESHQRDRINDLLGITFDPHGAGYNVHQSKIAIGSGGATGKGFLQGTQTKFDFVPEQSTDFIFCTVGEEWGFLGSFVVIVLFLLLFARIIILAEKQRLIFSRIYGYCVAAILFFHFTVNIGMTIGLAPVIGIPLPFFSYGGSSLWSFTLLLFTFLKLDADRLQVLQEQRR